MTSRSRLSRRQETKTKRNIFFTFIASILILFLLFKFGIPFLVSASMFISNINRPKESPSTSNQVSYLSPPVIDPLPSATNSGQIIVSGTALNANEVNLYVNGEMVDKQKIKEDNTFRFEIVQIKKGDNYIFVKSKNRDGNESNPTNASIIYKDSAPTLSIDTPSDNQTFSKDQNSVEITGKTDPGVKITVNDYWAIVEENGKFSYNLVLKSGDNVIKVIATDEAGNKTELKRTVKFNP